MFGTSRFGTALFAEAAFHVEELGAGEIDEEEMENMSIERLEPAEFGGSTTVEVAVSGTTTILTVTNQWQHRTIIFEVNNTDAEALDAFAVELQAHKNADWKSFQATWVAGTPVGLRFVSAALNTLAASSKATAILNIYGCYAFRFTASSATAASDVSIQGAAYGPVG